MRRPVSVAAVALAAVLAAASAQAADDTLYGVIFDLAGGSEGLVEVDPASGALTPLGAGIADCCFVSSGVSALDSAGDVFFFIGRTTAEPSGVDHLFAFDLATGALVGSPLLPAGFNYNFLAHDPSSGTLYAVVHEIATGSELLAAVDPASGALTPVGAPIAACCGVPSGTSALSPGAAFHFVGSRSSDALGFRVFSLDLATGAVLADPVLPAGFNYNFLGYDPASATLFAVAFEHATSTEILVAVDTATGALNPVGSGIPGCCLVANGVSAVDPGDSFHFIGRFQADVDVNRVFTLSLSDGTLTSSPLLPAGSNYNFLEFDPAPAPPAVAEVVIDVKPQGFPNPVNPRSRGLIPVAVLTTESFDAATVDPATARFGPAAAPPAHPGGHLEDVDGDGDLDLLLHFRTPATGIQCGDTTATLTAETFGGDAVSGSDSLVTVGCS
ncbi:MAG TPA: hypothetical protein VF100_06740 [Thermoanaerobaculia bacterium]